MPLTFSSSSFFSSEDEKFKNVPDSYWDSMITEVDKNGDGEIDYNEFREMMNTISLK